MAFRRRRPYRKSRKRRSFKARRGSAGRIRIGYRY